MLANAQLDLYLGGILVLSVPGVPVDLKPVDWYEVILRIGDNLVLCSLAVKQCRKVGRAAYMEYNLVFLGYEFVIVDAVGLRFVSAF